MAVMPTAAPRAIPDLGLMEVSALIASGAVTPLEVTEAVLARISAIDTSLRTYVALAAGRGLVRGPLHGVPVALKDLCETDFARLRPECGFMRTIGPGGMPRWSRGWNAQGR